MVPIKYTHEHLKTLVDAGVAEIGKHSYGGPAVRYATVDRRVRIGDYCSFADGVHIFLGGGHRPDWVTTYPFPAFEEAWPTVRGLEREHEIGKGQVIIGNDVWVGAGVWIGSGVTIGDGAVVGMRSVVVKDVPPYTIVGGNPARPIRRRFEDHQIEALLEIRWWDWDHDKVAENIPQLMDGDIDGFIAKHRPR